MTDFDDSASDESLDPPEEQAGPLIMYSAEGSAGPLMRPAVSRAVRLRRLRREAVRLLIVVLLFAMFGITVVWAFVSANGAHWNNVKDLLDLLLPAETALLGTAIAFYMTDTGRGGDNE